MVSKKILRIALICALNFLSISSLYNQKQAFSPLGKSKIIDKTITLKFFAPNSDDEDRPIALIRYSWQSDSKTVHLEHFEILSRKYRKKGLGKQLFTYFIEYIKKKERKVKVITWIAQALDPEDISQERVEAFYESLGGIKLYTETCNSADCTCDSPVRTHFNLTIDDFALSSTSLLHTMNIIEESNITRTKTIALAEL